jgi:hypothetical protein
MARWTGMIAAALMFAIPSLAAAKGALEQTASFDVKEANQAVGVDDTYFYAVDNQAIAKYDKKTGKLVKRWQGPKEGPILHLDSAMVMDGRIYCAHSNYPEWPMTSSLEVFDAQTLEHVASHSFGIQWGSLTWVDWHDGHWWMGFANYDKPFGPNNTRYGDKRNTIIVKMTRDYRPVESWTLPKVLLEKFEDMSNSGGSWGPDGSLYLTGHDPAELYRMRFPKAGSVLELDEIIPMNIRGQGVAWDRSDRGAIFGIIRASAAEKKAGAQHKVNAFRYADR